MSQTIYRVRTDRPDYPGSATDQVMTVDELRAAHPWLDALGDEHALEDIHSIRIVTLAPSSIIIEQE